MTRQQAMNTLPVLFRRMGNGAQLADITPISVFIDWLYHNQFEILSFKERKKREEPK